MASSVLMRCDRGSTLIDPMASRRRSKMPILVCRRKEDPAGAVRVKGVTVSLVGRISNSRTPAASHSWRFRCDAKATKGSSLDAMLLVMMVICVPRWAASRMRWRVAASGRK